MGGQNAFLGLKCVNGGQQVCTIEEMNKKTHVNGKKNTPGAQMMPDNNTRHVSWAYC